MAWVTVSSDSFNRTNGALQGMTLDNAAGGSESGNTWTELLGDSNVTDSTIVEMNGESLVYVGSTAAVADQRVTYTILAYLTPTQQGAVARWSAGTGLGNYYLGYSANTVFQLYRVTNGSATQLGSNAGTPAYGDELSCQCIGTAISLLQNGSTVIGPITDSTHASGKPGLYGTNRRFDDFLYEKDVASGLFVPRLYLNQAVKRAATW